MFNLTSQERKVILFLIGMFLIGLGVKFWVKMNLSNNSIANFTQNIGKFELNNVNKEELVSIKGIGEKLAQRIINYRQQKGRFNDLRELKNIKGINEYRYEKIRDSFYIIN